MMAVDCSRDSTDSGKFDDDDGDGDDQDREQQNQGENERQRTREGGRNEGYISNGKER